MDAVFWMIVCAVIAGSIFLAWALAGWSRRKGWPVIGQVFAAGLTPTILVIVGIWVWDRIYYFQLTEFERQESYLGPIIFLVYGYPLLLLTLVMNFGAAIAATKRK